MEILLGDNEYSLDRIGLRLWLELEGIREKLIKATGTGDIDNTALFILSYISVALGISTDTIQELPWYEVAYVYVDISMLCIPKYNLALLRPQESKQDRKVSWEYTERTFYLWSHTLAAEYGWTLEYISEMDFNDGLALLQEIIVQEQLDREWEWGLSEMAYEYVEAIKKSKFRPLPRPRWMTEETIIQPIKKTRILKAMMPVGNVIRMEMPDETIIH